MTDCFTKTDLQIPNSLKPKLTGMDPNVKSAMLRSSQHASMAPIVGTQTTRTLRKTRSSEALESPRAVSKIYSEGTARLPSKGKPEVGASSRLRKGSPLESLKGGPESTGKTEHGRGISLTIPRSRSTVNLNQIDWSKDSKDKEGFVKDLSAEAFGRILLNTSSMVLDIETVKKLRLMLRNEPTR